MSTKTEKSIIQRIVRGIRGPRIVAIALLFSTLIMVTVYSAGRSLTPSAEQKADYNFGTSNSWIDLRPLQLSEAIQSPGATLVEDIYSVMSEAGSSNELPGAVEVLHGNDLSLPRTNKRNPVYTEVYSDKPNPLAWRLESGRWPTEPGEVALSRAALPLQTEDHTVELITNDQPLRVVGTFVVPRSYDEVAILGAPGTYRWFYNAELDAAARPEFGIDLRTDTAGDQAEVAFAALLDRLRPLMDAHAAADDQQSQSLVMETFLTREKILGWGSTAVVDQDVWVFTVPLILVVAALVIGAFAVNFGWMKARSRQLSDIGANGKLLSLTYFQVLSAYVFGSLAIGSVLGVVVGYLGRPAVHRLAENDLSPWVVPVKPIVIGMATALIVLASLYIWMVTQVQRLQLRAFGRALFEKLSRPSRRRRYVALGIFLVLFIVEVFFFINEWTRTSMVVQTILLLLLTVWIGVFVGNKILSRSGAVLSPRSFARRLRSRHVLYRGVCVGMIALVTALPVGYSATNATWYNLKNIQTKRLTPADTVMVGTLDFAALPSNMQQQFEEATGLENPTTVYSTYLPDWTVGAAPTKAAGVPGDVLLIDKPSDADAFLAIPLTDVEADMLTRGGALTNKSASGAEGSSVDFQIVRYSSPPRSSSAPTQPNVTSVSVNSLPAEFREGWSNSLGLIMLRSEAEKLGFPVGNSRLIYSGVDKDQLAKAYDASQTLINGARFINVSYDPEKDLNPAILGVMAIGLTGLVFLICGAVALSVRRHLAPVAAQLQVLGMSSRWFRSVSRNIIILPVIVGGPIGVLAGLAPMVLMSLRYFGIELFGYDIRVIIVTLGALVLGSVCAPLVAKRLEKRMTA